jgi:predicted SAM-dependent methyltransferase
VYIDFGPGLNIHPDLYSVDYYWRPGIDLCWDVSKPLPFNDHSISAVFSEHCIEHIPFEAATRFIKELHRVLAPAGRVRIIVPDAGLYARKYLSAEPMPYAEVDETCGFYTRQMSVNRVYYGYGHRFIYDFETLAAVLGMAGFREIEKLSFGEGHDPSLLKDTEHRAVESLYVEAVA